MNVLGLGTDVVEVDRMQLAITRRKQFVSRLFTAHEQEESGTHNNSAPRLAARFAAKEAVMKALGVGIGSCAFQEIEVVTKASGEPTLELTGRAKEHSTRLGVSQWMMSLSHTDTTAFAVVMALGS